MEFEENTIKPILEKAESLGKTSFTLIKLKLLDKTADISSSIISRLLLLMVLCFFVLTLNISIALWLGDILGKNYYGFLAIALFYGLAAVILLLIQPKIKIRISDFIIKKSLAGHA
jgi:hypothetical protein